MKFIFRVLVAAVCLTLASGAEMPLWQAPIPSNIERFVPVGWVSTQSVQGDLNGDGMADVASVLEREDTVDGNPVEVAGSRGLLVLLADPSGGYRFQDFAPEALPCVSCLGDLGGEPHAPAIKLAIAGQRLTVRWRRDFPQTKEIKLIIGYDSERGALRLLGDEALTADRLSGKTVRVVRDYRAGTMTSDGRESRLAPRFIPLIEVSAEDL